MSKRVLVLCTGNSCRSQMAEGFLKSFGGEVEAYSAGTNPASRVHPLAVEVMKEAGIDISESKPKSVLQFLDDSFDYVVTVCDHARETCPVFTGNVAHRIHIGFEDPAEAKGSEAEVLEVFRKVRDSIRESFHALFEKELNS